MPKVTILINATDAGPAVMAAISSALHQTWEGLRIVAAARSAAVHQALRQKILSPRVWIVAPPPGEHALNHAMRHALGEYIVRLEPGFKLLEGALPRLVDAGLRGGVAIGPGEFRDAGGHRVRECRGRGLLTAQDYGELLCTPPMLVKRYFDRPYRDTPEAGALHDAEIAAVANCIVAADGKAMWQCERQQDSRQTLRRTMSRLAAAGQAVLYASNFDNDEYMLDEGERLAAVRILKYREFVMSRYLDRLGFGSNQGLDRFMDERADMIRAAFTKRYGTAAAMHGYGSQVASAA